MSARLIICSIFIYLACVLPAGAADNNIVKGKQQDSSGVFEPGVYTGNFAYVIGPGDTLEIKVWRHPDLENNAVVRPDGQISFPLIGDIYACDSTPAELKDKIASGLRKVINDPQVTVNVTGFQSKKIFVLGEVNRPGVYPFEGRVSVLDAISKAAGYKEDTAALKSIILIRRGYSLNPKALRVNIYDVIAKGDVKQDIFLEPADIVFVPKTFIANIDTFIDQFFTKTDPVLQYYLDIYDIRHGTPGTRSR